jgi:hypothetical protein
MPKVMVLVQLLLPVKSGNHLELAATRQELVSRFSGLTAYVRAPARGAWVSPQGHQEDDDVIMVEVLAETFDRRWWRAYAIELAARFDEREIHVRALPAEVP